MSSFYRKWVPVSERKPVICASDGMSDTMLITVETILNLSNGNTRSIRRVEIGVYNYINGRWYYYHVGDESGLYLNESVVAWTEMPKPYEGDIFNE